MAFPFRSPVPASPAKLNAPADWGLRLERSMLGLLALVLVGVPLFFHTRTMDQFELPKLTLLRALSSLLLGGLLARLALAPRPLWRRSPADLPLLAFSLWLGVKTVFSVSPALSWRGEYENFAGSLTQLNYSLLFWLALQVAGGLDRARLLARALGLGAAAACFYALLQACQLDFITWSSQSVIADRFFGPMGNPNFLAGLACMAIPLRLALAWDQSQQPAGRDWDGWARFGVLLIWLPVYLFNGKFPWGLRPGADLGAAGALLFWLAASAAVPLLRRLGRPRPAQWLGLAADLLLLFKALANTGTRGGFLGLMAGMTVLVLGWVHWQRQGAPWRRFAVRAGAALGVALLLLSLGFLGLGKQFRARVALSLANPAQALETSRWQIWVPAVKIWKDHPLTGTGVDTFKSVFPSYSTSRFNRYDGDNVSSRMAHCEPLQLLATMGIVGLALWLWFCGTLAMAWWRRLAAAQEGQALLVGLGALGAAYLAQNLVSFGVSAISVPFFMAMALLFFGPAPELELKPARLGTGWALAAGLAVALGGLWLAGRTFTADRHYAFGSQIHSQLQASPQMALDDARGMAAYAVQGLQSWPGPLPAPAQEELKQWLPRLVEAEKVYQANPSQGEAVRAEMQRGGGVLLYVLAALHFEQAVLLCPSEVKYQVYLGLAYEELFKRCAPEHRAVWFERAAQAYARSVELNPQNAYYHGNAGRLYGMGAEAGSANFLPLAEKHYLDAIAIAPVTRLFYENLLLLYARYAMLDGAKALMDKVEARDKELAPSLLMAGAGTFYQWRGMAVPAWTPAKKKEAQSVCLDWARRAVALAPAAFRDAREQSDYADYAFSLASFYLDSGQRIPAKAALNRALEWRPGDPAMLQYKKDHQL
jgi:hypothetical protein